MFEETTYETILERMKDRVSDSMDKREGSIIHDALAPTAIELQLVYIDLDTVLREVFTDTASREYLARRAEERDITPHEPTAAVWKAELLPKTLDVEMGTRFNCDSMNLSVIGKREDGIYELICETAGTIGNRCQGELIPINYVAGLERASLTELLNPGTDEEETEAFRDRYLTILRKPATSGNKYEYYNWAMACDGVGAAKIFPLANGAGTVKVVIANAEKGAASELLCQQVFDYIEERRPIGAQVEVVSAVELPLNVTAQVELGKDFYLGQVQTTFRERLAEWLQDQGFEAEDISIAHVGKLLLETGGVEDYTGLVLNGSAQNVPLSEEQIAVAGEIRLEVIV